MRESAPRYVPLISGVVALAAATALLAVWVAPSGLFYWVRGAIFGFLTWYGVWDLKVAAFASDHQIDRATSGDVEVWKERDVAAPSAFDLQDVLFMSAAFGVFLIFIVVICYILGLLNWMR
jgi:hypothetical protein